MGASRVGRRQAGSPAQGSGQGSAPAPRPLPAPPCSATRVESQRSDGAPPTASLERVVTQAPSFLISAVVHMLLLILLGLLFFSTPTEPTNVLSVWADPDNDSSVDLEAPLSIEPPTLTKPEALLTPAPALASDPFFAPKAIDVPWNGLTPYADQPISPTGEPVTANASSGAPDVANTPVINLARAHRDAVKVAQEGMGEGLATLRRYGRERIIVVRGTHDRIEEVLKMHEIPYRFLDVGLARGLDPQMVLCVNCGADPPVALLQQFTAKGGWLITSDWALAAVSRSFPSYVRMTGSGNPDTTVRVATVNSMETQALLRGVPSQGQWWLESGSFFGAVDSRRVQVLVTSDEMQERFGASPVAFEFRPGRGRVLHVVGHFYQMKGTQRGLVAMHRLILNYLAERVGSQVKADDEAKVESEAKPGAEKQKTSAAKTKAGAKPKANPAKAKADATN